MTTRRDFLKTAAAAAAGISFSGFYKYYPEGDFVSRRPAPEKRKFISEAVESAITEIQNNITDKELGWLFGNCFPNTLDTTVTYQLNNGKPDTFVITGDINAMWLRDSSAQVWPYVPLTKDDPSLRSLIAGVINRQARCILIDPYANAFNYSNEGSQWEKDITKMRPELHERKWEIDSLCYPVRLAYKYWKVTGDTSCFDETWTNAMRLVLQTFREQQRFNGPGPYTFQRQTTRWNDTLPINGLGMPTKPNGLIHSMFRPSDDSCLFPMLIPSNMFASVSLKQLAEIADTAINNKPLRDDALFIKNQVDEALDKFASGEHAEHGNVYAFEVDGYGNQYFIDDANVPNLLSLPYLGYCSNNDPKYQSTRRFVLSSGNPFYYKGTAAAGLGGLHTEYNYVWHLGIIMQGLTSSDTKEIAECIRTLKTTHAGTGFMHESFSKDNPAVYTRDWFAWANTLFGEFILKVYNEYPAILKS